MTDFISNVEKKYLLCTDRLIFEQAAYIQACMMWHYRKGGNSVVDCGLTQDVMQQLLYEDKLLPNHSVAERLIDFKFHGNTRAGFYELDNYCKENNTSFSVELENDGLSVLLHRYVDYITKSGIIDYGTPALYLALSHHAWIDLNDIHGIGTIVTSWGILGCCRFIGKHVKFSGDASDIILDCITECWWNSDKESIRTVASVATLILDEADIPHDSMCKTPKDLESYLRLLSVYILTSTDINKWDFKKV